MAKISGMEADYIGDGVYTLYDGFGIWLYANDTHAPTDKIYLEPAVLRSLIQFSKRMEMINDSSTTLPGCQDESGSRLE